MNQKSSDQFEKYLNIENELELWDYSINGIQIWPLVRARVYTIAARVENNYSVAHAGVSLKEMFKPKYISEFLNAGSFFLSSCSYYDSVFFSSARYLHYNEEKGIFYNSFFKPYYDLFLNPLIFEESYQFNIKKPRELEESIFLSDYLTYGSTVRSYISRLLDLDGPIKLSEFAREICNAYSISEYYTQIRGALCRKTYGAHYLEKYVDKIVSCMDTNIAFIHCASYMGDAGVITRRFKEHGVVTIELQHGYVGPEHYAYNYPSGDAERAKEYLPDYYLTFGKYWGEQIRTPSNIVAVGNPVLNKSVDDLQKSSSPRSNSILVVSQGTVTSSMVRIAKYLAQELPGYSIVFKLHPGEVPFTHRYEDLKKYHNVQIRTYDNIYELIASSEIIVGYNSTTLFETVAFDGKRIFILDNGMIPDSLGYKFSSCEELRDAILDGESGYPSVQPSYFWESDWETNISSFLKGLSL